MKKQFKVSVPVDYVMGHLRYGHYEFIVEAETVEEAIELAKEEEEEGDGELVVDDWEVSGYGDTRWNEADVKEV